MKSYFFCKKGFSFLEVVIASVVMATAAVGLLRVVTSTQVITPQNVQRSFASGMARQQIESMMDGVRADWWDGTLPATADNQRLLIGNHTGNPPTATFNGTTFNSSYSMSTVSLAGDGGGQDYRRIDQEMTS